VKPHVLFAAALLFCSAAGVRAADPQGAAVPHEPNPDAPADARSGVAPPQGGSDAEVAQCGERIKAGSQIAGNPADFQEDAAAHERRVRAVVKLFVAEQLHKTKNGKACLANAEEAQQLLAGEPQPSSGSSTR
jgi:hypothetical protein